MEKPKKKKNKIRFSAGSILLDLVVGGGLGLGYPSGKIINIVGDKSSGKTFLACEIIAAAFYFIVKVLKKTFKWCYDDAESGFTFDTEQLYGLKVIPEDEKRVKSKTVEQWYGNTRQFFEDLGPGEFGIYVLDSLDGLSSKEMEKRADKRFRAHKQNKEFKEGSYQMAKAKFMSQEFFPPLSDLIEKKQGLLIIISQTRDKIDSMFKSQTRAGGRALDFYAHTCLWLSSVYKEKKKGRPVSVIIKAHAKKSKTPRPFRECILNLIFDYGLDDIGSSLDFLYNLRGEDYMLKKAADFIKWDGGEDLTIKNLITFLKEDEEIYKQYKKDNPANLLKAGDKIDAIVGWIESKGEELVKRMNERFGTGMSREKLIDYIEANDLENELKERVIEKWEKIEEEIKSHRKKKYNKV